MTPAMLPALTPCGNCPPAPKGYRVALWQGDYSQEAIAGLNGNPAAMWTLALVSDHRTLGAACRKLAHYIARQGRRGYQGPRFDRFLVVLPDGIALSLNAARDLAKGVR